MRVRIEAENNRSAMAGEVISWTNTIRYIGGERGNYFAIPAVVLRTFNEIRVVPLVNDVGVALLVTVLEE